MTHHRIISQNIMGTPAMSAKRVRADMRTMKNLALGVYCLQEFKFKWYWAALLFYFPVTRWGKYPMGYLGPRSSQPIIWDRKRYKCLKRRRILLHGGHSARLDPSGHGWEDRYITAVLLQDRVTGLCFWVTNRHYLPAAWSSPASSMRRSVWSAANGRDQQFIQELMDDGHVVFALGDYNWPARVYIPVINDHRTNYHGWLKSIDKVITWNNKHGRVYEVAKHEVSTANLNTDHGGKVLVFRLEKD
jgi:hypothetical protein